LFFWTRFDLDISNCTWRHRPLEVLLGELLGVEAPGCLRHQTLDAILGLRKLSSLRQWISLSSMAMCESSKFLNKFCRLKSESNTPVHLNQKKLTDSTYFTASFPGVHPLQIFFSAGIRHCFQAGMSQISKRDRLRISSRKPIVTPEHLHRSSEHWMFSFLCCFVRAQFRVFCL
jgi:hypothetical protein